MSDPKATLTDSSFAGDWRITARAPGMPPLEVTFVRGAPTQYGDMVWEDPFGPKSMSLIFPKLSLFDQLGAGDLWWLTQDTDIDIAFTGALPAQAGTFVWEGGVASFDYGQGGLEVQLAGAMYELDGVKAKPRYPFRPIPYEYAIAAQWADLTSSSLRQPRVEFPSWWSTRYSSKVDVPLYMRPTGVRSGQLWTGLVTRQTGSWDDALSSYIQTLLSSMYTARGRWTLDLDTGRRPVLRHRNVVARKSGDFLVIDPAAPGVNPQLNVDYSQSLNVVYGQGVSLAGEGYSGQLVSSDGQLTEYEPLAALRQVHPSNPANLWWQPSRKRREVQLQLQQGLSYQQAKQVGTSHLQRFTDPGVTGTIELESDPMWGTVRMPRACLKAGMSLQLIKAFGHEDGIILHITAVTTSLSSGTTTLTVDSKFRDALTVDEVRLRGRDSLAVTRQLIGGQYAPPIPDQLVPWNYSEGSGFIPSGSGLDCRPLFTGVRSDIRFPWTEITTKRPPKDPAWRNCYIFIDKASANASQNWAARPNRAGQLAGIPIRAAQQASIRLLQIAAYDENGYVMRVPFHISFYMSAGVNTDGMPRLDAARANSHPPYLPGQRYPFFDGAWERYLADGTQVQNEESLATASSGLIRGYGTGRYPAGFWPGQPGGAEAPSGMLVDEGVFEIDTTKFDNAFNPYVRDQVAEGSGMIYAMIYCDQQGDRPVYFMGRMFRADPGTRV